MSSSSRPGHKCDRRAVDHALDGWYSLSKVLDAATAMYTYANVYAFLAEQLRVDAAELTPDISLRDDLGVEGDDFFELEKAFSQRFGVDMSERWYFHHRDEGFLFTPSRLFFRPPYSPIPVTPKLLLECANAGRWILEYPPHKGPPRRYDVLATVLFICPICLLPLLAKWWIEFRFR